MSASKPVLYEGMFLFDSTAVHADAVTATDALRVVLDRAEAEIVTMYKWDERKLAYPIKGQKRGLYLLVYFKARGTQIPNIERDVKLSDHILRCLILRADHVGETELELAEQQAKETQAEAAMRAEGGEAETAGAGAAAEGQPAAETVEGSGTESPAAASTETAAARPTPEAEGQADTASESGTRSE